MQTNVADLATERANRNGGKAGSVAAFVEAEDFLRRLVLAQLLAGPKSAKTLEAELLKQKQIEPSAVREVLDQLGNEMLISVKAGRANGQLLVTEKGRAVLQTPAPAEPGKPPTPAELTDLALVWLADEGPIREDDLVRSLAKTFQLPADTIEDLIRAEGGPIRDERIPKHDGKFWPAGANGSEPAAPIGPLTPEDFVILQLKGCPVPMLWDDLCRRLMLAYPDTISSLAAADVPIDALIQAGRAKSGSAELSSTVELVPEASSQAPEAGPLVEQLLGTQAGDGATGQPDPGGAGAQGVDVLEQFGQKTLARVQTYGDKGISKSRLGKWLLEQGLALPDASSLIFKLVEKGLLVSVVDRVFLNPNPTPEARADASGASGTPQPEPDKGPVETLGELHRKAEASGVQARAEAQKRADDAAAAHKANRAEDRSDRRDLVLDSISENLARAKQREIAELRANIESTEEKIRGQREDIKGWKSRIDQVQGELTPWAFGQRLIPDSERPRQQELPLSGDGPARPPEPAKPEGPKPSAAEVAAAVQPGPLSLEGVTELRGLSLWQPWASAIAAEAVAPGKGKHIETRDKVTEHRGLLAIQSSKSWKDEQRETCSREPFRTALEAVGHGIETMPLGSVVALVELVEIVPTSDPSLADLSPTEVKFGDYGPDRFAWKLGRIVNVNPPIPCKGARGVFEVPADVLEQLRKQMHEPKQPPVPLEGISAESRRIDAIPDPKDAPLFPDVEAAAGVVRSGDGTEFSHGWIKSEPAPAAGPMAIDAPIPVDVLERQRPDGQASAQGEQQEVAGETSDQAAGAVIDVGDHFAAQDADRSDADAAAELEALAAADAQEAAALEAGPVD